MRGKGGNSYSKHIWNVDISHDSSVQKVIEQLLYAKSLVLAMDIQEPSKDKSCQGNYSVVNAALEYAQDAAGAQEMGR